MTRVWSRTFRGPGSAKSGSLTITRGSPPARIFGAVFAPVESVRPPAEGEPELEEWWLPDEPEPEPKPTDEPDGAA